MLQKPTRWKAFEQKPESCEESKKGRPIYSLLSKRTTGGNLRESCRCLQRSKHSTNNTHQLRILHCLLEEMNSRVNVVHIIFALLLFHCFPTTAQTCYQCNNCQCAVDPNGCNDGDYTSLAGCQANCCNSPTTYSCIRKDMEDQCVPDPAGPYPGLNDCQMGCVDDTDLCAYKCDTYWDNRCYQGTGSNTSSPCPEAVPCDDGSGSGPPQVWGPMPMQPCNQYDCAYGGQPYPGESGNVCDNTGKGSRARSSQSARLRRLVSASKTTERV